MSEEYTRGQTGRGRKQLFTTAAHTRQEVLRGGGAYASVCIVCLHTCSADLWQGVENEGCLCLLVVL